MVIYLLSLTMTEYLNSVLIVDLYLSITNPFVPRESRFKFYYIVPVLTVVAYIVLNLSSGVFGNADRLFVHWYPAVLELVTFVCGCRVVYLLCQKRTSPMLKKLVLKRHMLYFAFYLLFMITENIAQYLPNEIHKHEKFEWFHAR